MQMQRRYVRVTSNDRPGFVEFDFSIGDPDIYLEMILPVQAFDEFCRSNQVTFLADRQAEAVARQREKWHHGEADDSACLAQDNPGSSKQGRPGLAQGSLGNFDET